MTPPPFQSFVVVTVGGDYLSFNLIIHLLTVITFPLILCSVSKNTLVQPVLPVTTRRNKPSSRTRRCSVNQGWGNEYPTSRLGEGEVVSWTMQAVCARDIKL